MGRKLINGLLLLVVAGSLTLYFFTVRELPERIYTYEQEEYLAYNNNRSITQSAPALNSVLPDGMAGNSLDVLTLMPNSESHVRANLKARYEEQEGITVTVYDLDFQGEYLLVGPESSAVEVELLFRFPDNLETLHDVHFDVDGDEPPNVVYTTSAIRWRTTLLSGDTHRVNISYKADGANTFAYGLPSDQRSEIDVVVTVTGLSGSSVPNTSLLATKTSAANGSETFTWNYAGLIANRNIELSLPTRLSFAQRIAELHDDFRLMAMMAPILVGLFIACLAGLLSLASVRLSLEGYLLAGLGLALFYPLLTFSSGVIGVLPAAIAALVVVSGLLFVFLGRVAGLARTWRPLGILLLIFAGFFSLGILTPWRDLLLTGGGLLLLVTFMWTYARRPAGVSAQEPESTDIPDLAELPNTDAGSYCMHCGKLLEDAYTFCPDCGHDVRTVLRCEGCGHQQYVPSGAEPAYCVHCGNQLASYFAAQVNP